MVATSIRRSGRIGNESAIPEATVRFTVDGKEIVAGARISQKSYETLKTGDVVQIRYASDDPRLIEVDAGINRKIALILGGVALASLGLFIFVFRKSWRFARNAIAVRNGGKRSLVKVTEHQAPMFVNQKKPTTRLVWLDGRGMECKSLEITKEAARSYRVGREIAIYELPNSNLDSFWEGDLWRT